MGRPFAASLQVEQESGQLDMRVAATVEDTYAVLTEDLPGLGGRLPGDHEQRRLGMSLGVLDELPSDGGVRPASDIECDGDPSAGEAKGRLAPTAMTTRFSGGSNARECPEDGERFRFDRFSNIHS